MSVITLKSSTVSVGWRSRSTTASATNASLPRDASSFPGVKREPMLGLSLCSDARRAGRSRHERRIATLYLAFAYAHALAFARQPRASLVLLVALETLFATFFVTRRGASATSGSAVHPRRSTSLSRWLRSPRSSFVFSARSGCWRAIRGTGRTSCVRAGGCCRSSTERGPTN